MTNHLRQLYKDPLALLTDFYQITMIYAAWKAGTVEGDRLKTAVFNLYFRTNPFQGGYAIACGFNSVLDFIEGFQISDQDAEYLESLQGPGGQKMFEPAFIDFLKQAKLSVDIHAVDEGRVVFASEPLLRVHGPLWQCQLLETALLNIVNFETLIATKAARVKSAAGDDEVLEFGLRRAHGPGASVLAARAAFVGGADATSNVLAGKLFGLPVRGTHAHSWVMSYDDELEAFQKFAEAMPGNSVFLVDTYNTLEGVQRAAAVGKELKKNAYQMLGIRLDSGDLAYLSIEARKILDAAGLLEAKIVASNDLDEQLIQSLKMQGARIDIWGVGTKLVTAYDQPALGGVFKMTAMKDGDSAWKYRMKLSEQTVKVTTPGVHQIRRFKTNGLFSGDMIYDIHQPPNQQQVIIDPLDPTRRKSFEPECPSEDLLKPVVISGKAVVEKCSLKAICEKRKEDLYALHPSIQRFLNPHAYPVGLELSLHEMKTKKILELRGLQRKEAR